MADLNKDKKSPEKHGQARTPSGRPVESSGDAAQDKVIPVVQEELKVGKRTVETGEGVRVSKTVSEREETVDEPLTREEVCVEHVAVNEVITGAAMPTTRYEGQTLIVPILEEELVVEKRTILKEELHITRRRHEFRDPQRVVLRTERVSVEHFNDANDSVEPSATPGEQD